MNEMEVCAAKLALYFAPPKKPCSRSKHAESSLAGMSYLEAEILCCEALR
jgi:hypothetical protein